MASRSAWGRLGRWPTDRGVEGRIRRRYHCYYNSSPGTRHVRHVEGQKEAGLQEGDGGRAESPA